MVDRSHIVCETSHLSQFAFEFMPFDPVTGESYVKPNLNESSTENDTAITVEDMVNLNSHANYFGRLNEMLQHKHPDAHFMLKPGIYVFLAFWFLYLTGMFKYTGLDRERLPIMTRE